MVVLVLVLVPWASDEGLFEPPPLAHAVRSGVRLTQAAPHRPLVILWLIRSSWFMWLLRHADRYNAPATSKHRRRFLLRVPGIPRGLNLYVVSVSSPDSSF